MKKMLLILCLTFPVGSLLAQTMTDAEGNNYQTTKIGNQIWSAENLKVTKTPDGTAIDAWPYNGDESKVSEFGRMYNWEVAKKVCPEGWHLPSDKEWVQLIEFLGGPMNAGGKLKETGTTHWKAPNKGATNESGFTALPVGYRTGRGKYLNFKMNLAYFWGATDAEASNAWGYYITYGEPIIYRYSYTFTKDMGFSVRCVKNE